VQSLRPNGNKVKEGKKIAAFAAILINAQKKAFECFGFG
jgi:hypothetical protein